MRVTVYHNPRCGTSRKVLEIIRERGVEPEVIDYLADPPGRAELETLRDRLGLGARDLLRRNGTPYDELGLDDPNWSDEALIDTIAEHPILLQRPVVVTAKGAKICRPAEVVNTLL
ncbi:MAG TPA: arsenate reductase (glutaredoxin) [Thermohalobaculum sp.]|nr:arsenate reductase (glutaredoxin) [Thermohalobaculum sp.]